MLDHASRFKIPIATATSVMVAALAWFWIDSPESHRPTAAFAVSGFSMAPTLLGPAEILKCPRCSYSGPFPLSFDEIKGLCAQCGGKLQRTGETRPPDRLIRFHGQTAIHRGDLVAIARGGSEHVKRIVAIPGDVIDIEGSQLTNNGQPIQQMLWRDDRVTVKPTVQVYRDTLHGSSRWQRKGDWLIYHHINPYRGGAPSPVMDDYAFNLDLARRLEPATDLIVTGASEGQPLADAEYQIWNPNDPYPAESLVGPTHPIAIRCEDSEDLIGQLEVRRLIVYRLGPRDDRSKYPLQVGDNEYFVLGDNVPISVDSRQWGSVAANQILAVLARLAR